MMISRKVEVNGIEYTVSASTLRGLEEAISYLKESLKEVEHFTRAMEQSNPAEDPKPSEEPKPDEGPKPKRSRKKKDE